MFQDIFSQALWFGLQKIGAIWVVKHLAIAMVLLLIIRFLLKQKAWGLLVIVAWALAASDFVSPGMGTFGVPLSINQFFHLHQTELTVKASDYDDIPTWARNWQERLDFRQPKGMAEVEEN